MGLERGLELAKYRRRQKKRKKTKMANTTEELTLLKTSKVEHSVQAEVAGNNIV